MKYSIDLQSPFSFSNYWYAAAIGLIALAVLLRFLIDRLFAVQVRSPFRLDRLHRDCMAKISAIESSYNSNAINSREVHQQMSREVRKFIRNVTGLQAETMVCEDLCRTGRPELAALIKSYYAPEFARTFKVDTKESLEKGRELVNSVYQRALKEQQITRTVARQEAVNTFLSKIMRITVWPFRKNILRMIRHNSLTWMERIELAFCDGSLDPYSVREQMKRAVKSYVDATAGAQKQENAFHEMDDAAPSDFTPEEARQMIQKGKELVKR